MKKKQMLIMILVICFTLVPFRAKALDAVYDKNLDDVSQYSAFRAVATKDGGYAVLSGSLQDKIIGIIKYSSDGNKLWSNTYDVSQITTFYPGFTELDNGKLVAVTNNLIYVISENGTLLNTIDVSNTLGNFLGFRCTGDGTGTACAAIGMERSNESIIGIVFLINEDGTLGNAFQVPTKIISFGSDSAYLGLPVSIFKNNSNDIVVETVEGLEPQVYIFDNNLNQKSKKAFSIDGSQINLIQQVGDVHWLMGQFSNNNYFGGYIKYAGQQGMSNANFTTYDSGLNGVLNKKQMTNAYFDIGILNNSNIPPTTQIELIRSGLLGLMALTDGYRVGRYASVVDGNLVGDLSTLESSNPNVELDLAFVRLDSDLNEIGRYQLFHMNPTNMSLGKDDSMLLYFNSIIRLKDGSDVIVTNLSKNGTMMGRHIKIAKSYVVTPVSQSSADVTFEKSVYEPGDVVKIQLRQKDGYYVDKVIVRDESGKIIDVDMKNQTFVMPASDVTVEVQYKKIDQVKTGIITSILLSVVAIVLLGLSSMKYFKKQSKSKF